MKFIYLIQYLYIWIRLQVFILFHFFLTLFTFLFSNHLTNHDKKKFCGPNWDFYWDFFSCILFPCLMQVGLYFFIYFISHLYD